MTPDSRHTERPLEYHVVLQGPTAIGRRFTDRSRAERWMAKQQARGFHPVMLVLGEPPDDDATDGEDSDAGQQDAI